MGEPQDDAAGRVAVVLDVDGTLLDSNYHHAIAWARAFDHAGVDVPVWRIHRPSAWAPTSWSPR